MKAALTWLSIALAGLLFLASPAAAQPAPATDAAASGAAPDASKLDAILARQRGEGTPRAQRDDGSAAAQGAGLFGQLGGNRGAQSDSEVWEALRFGTADIRASNTGPAADVIMQSRGMWWLDFRSGGVARTGAIAMLAVLVVLAAFYAIKGKLRVRAGYSGRTVPRHGLLARFSHWLLAISFILLALTGLVVLFGRDALIPLLGPEAFGQLALASKWLHNMVGWAFMVALVLILLQWTWDNLPDRYDIPWLLRGGGILFGGHPSSTKFNAGEKIVFWSTIGFGAILSLSGIALMFPFEFAATEWVFAQVNALGIPAMLGVAPLPTVLSPQEGMQFVQLAHLIAAFLLMVVVMGHIFMGAVWVEGAMSGMTSGRVDENWAREHHDIWAAQLEKKGLMGPAPAGGGHHGAGSGRGHAHPHPAE